MALAEDSGLGQFCILVVKDADQDNTADFTLVSSGFSISPSLPEFGVIYSDGSPTATIELQSTLDFEQTKSYPLTITVSSLIVIIIWFITTNTVLVGFAISKSSFAKNTC